MLQPFLMFSELDLLKRATPLMQAFTSALLALLAMSFTKVFFAGNGNEYSGAFIGIVFFTLINSVVSIFHTSFKAYTLPSFIFYFLLAAVLLLSAKAFSGISIWNLAEYRFMFTSVTIFYLTAGVLVRLIRMIYEFADNEENMQ